MTNLTWNKCGESKTWCDFFTLNLTHEHFDDMEGVYIIWHTGNPAKTVRVGQGVIKDRLASHRDDRAIAGYKSHGMKVTWARVSATQRNGVERYLAEALSPLVGDRFPDVAAIQVNLPW